MDKISPNNIPLVSICIPSYNCENYINQCIRSVYEQEYSNIELIITDDASTDNSVDVINEIIKKAPDTVQVKFHQSNENLGLAGNWNWAMSLATGKYIKVLPCDDFIYRDCISSKAQLLENNPALALAYSKRDVINKSGKKIVTTGYTPSSNIKALSLVKKCILNGTNVIGEPGAVLFRADIAQKIGDFDGSIPYLIDLDYWLRLLKHGNAASIDRALCVFRIDQNLSVRLGKKRVSQFIQFIEQLSNEWGISSFILMLGKLRARLNEYLRRLFYIYSKFVG